MACDCVQALMLNVIPIASMSPASEQKASCERPAQPTSPGLCADKFVAYTNPDFFMRAADDSEVDTIETSSMPAAPQGVSHRELIFNDNQQDRIPEPASSQGQLSIVSDYISRQKSLSLQISLLGTYGSGRHGRFRSTSTYCAEPQKPWDSLCSSGPADIVRCLKF
jgi:hypothetical protein